jgi:hypothetical protein
MNMTRKQALKADAQNRSLRTFLQGLGIDIAVGVALVLVTLVGGWNSWGDVQWAILTFSLAKSVVQAVAAYIMRMWLDKSSIPTPTPPGDDLT